MKNLPKKTHIILYVQDQEKSKVFYIKVLGLTPTLDVAGMTEFQIGKSTILGLMPEKGIKQLLGAKLPPIEKAHGIPRTELYLIVDKPQDYHSRALESGALELSPLCKQDWGHRAAYSLDPDGHVLAFAEELL